MPKLSMNKFAVIGNDLSLFIGLDTTNTGINFSRTEAFSGSLKKIPLN